MSKLVNLRGPDAGQATIDDLCAHIDHIRRVAGIETVALGPDWADYSERFANATQQYGFTMVATLETIDRLPAFTEGLLRHGYSEPDVEAILGGNLQRVLRAALPDS